MSGMTRCVADVLQSMTLACIAWFGMGRVTLKVGWEGKVATLRWGGMTLACIALPIEILLPAEIATSPCCDVYSCKSMRGQHEKKGLGCTRRTSETCAAACAARTCPGTKCSVFTMSYTSMCCNVPTTSVSLCNSGSRSGEPGATGWEPWARNPGVAGSRRSSAPRR